jgi:DNA-binding XRE family transcriptional regulator
MTIAEPLALTDEIVVLRRATYDALMAAVEDALDARALADLRAREASGEAEYVPIELADRIAAGEHPVRAWREHRGLTLGALAKSAGIAPSYLSEIEAGRKPGSTRALAALAKTLRVAIEDLLAIGR